MRRRLLFAVVLRGIVREATVSQWLLPLRLSVLWRFRYGAPQSDLGIDRAFVRVLGGFGALAAAGAGYGAFAFAPERMTLVADRLSVLLFSTMLMLAMLPILQMFARSSPWLPVEWPLSGAQRGLGDLLYGTLGGFTCVYVAFALGAAWSRNALHWPAFLVVLVASAVATVAIALFVQTLVEWLGVSTWVRLLAAFAVAAGARWLLSPGSGGSLRTVLWWAVPPVAVARLISASSGRQVWIAVVVAIAQALMWSTAFLELMRQVHWQWRARESSIRGVANVENPFLAAMAGLPAPSTAVGALRTFELVTLARSPRFWFMLLYSIVATVFFLRMVPTWARLFTVAVWMPFGSATFLYNLFAFDGPGVALWLWAPITPRDVLRGRNLGVFLAWLPALGLTLALGAFATGDRASLPVAALLFVYFALIHAAVGNFASIVFPRGLGIRDMWQTFVAPPASLLLIVTLAWSGALAGACWWFTRDAWGWNLTAQAVLTLAAMAFYWSSLRSAARLFASSRESLAASIAGAV